MRVRMIGIPYLHEVVVFSLGSAVIDPRVEGFDCMVGIFEELDDRYYP